MKSWSHAVDFNFFNLGTLGFCQRVGFVFYLYFFMFLLVFIFILKLILYSNYILCILFATLNSWNTQIKIRYAIFEYFKLNSSDFFTKISLNQNRDWGGPELWRYVLFCQNMADLQISNSFEYLKSFYIKFINGILM